MKGRALAIVIAVLSATTLLAGCDGGARTGKTPSSPPAAAADPAIKEAVHAAPAFDVGHTVHVTSAGIQPRSLASMCCEPVVFKNETGQPISVVFIISKIDSGPIAPGGTWQWVPANPQSVGYRLGSDPNAAGHIQIESPTWG